MNETINFYKIDDRRKKKTKNLLDSNFINIADFFQIFNVFSPFSILQETTQIEESNEKVEREIHDLKKQIEELHNLLKEHDCPKQLPYSGGNTC